MIWVLTYCTIALGGCVHHPTSVEFSTGKKDCLEALAIIEKQARANDQKFRGVCAPKAKP
jgi:hypothetical protein